ncbi:MAG: methyltransferase [Firmicutes bacterium]|nr:methyltransferase [Bacillota bacterium]
MTHRERVLASLNHEEPDRVAIDFGGMRSTGIHAMAYNQLKKHLGLAGGRTRVYDIMQQLAEPEKEVLDILGGDVVQLHRYEPSFGVNIRAWKKGTLLDGSECEYPLDLNPVVAEDGSKLIVQDGTVVARMPKDGFWYDFAYFPLANAESYKDIDEYEFPDITGEELEFLREEAKQLKATMGEYAVLGAFGGNIFENGMFTFGIEKFLTEIAINPRLVEYFLDRMADKHVENLKKYMDAVGDYIDIIQMGDDLGTQNGLYISREMYRKLIKPYQARVYEAAHKLNPRVKVFLHSCGSIYDLIPDLIEIGVDVLNPVQTTAAKMDPATLKREFGRDIAFWGGGVDTQTVMLFGTPDEVRKQVRERLSIFAPGGGYVFNQVHNIQPGVPPENIVAAYAAAQGR